MVVTDKYVLFWGEEFSNFFPAKFVVGDRIFYNSEQYFMWNKAKYFLDYESANEIYKEGKEPKIAKKLGRKVKNFVDSEWMKVRFEYMRKALFYKFSQNKELKEKLLSYGDRTFVEASPYDKIWGIGLREDDEAAKDSKNWLGENLLGKALCLTRDYFKFFDGDYAKKSDDEIVDAIDLIGIDKIVELYKPEDILRYMYVKDVAKYYGNSELMGEIPSWEAIDEYGETEILNNIEPDEVVSHYTTRELLDEMPRENILDYMLMSGLGNVDYSEDEEIKDALINICRTIKPRGELNKKDVKEILNKFIDDNIFN